MVTTKDKYPENYRAFKEWQNIPEGYIEGLEDFFYFFDNEFEYKEGSDYVYPPKEVIAMVKSAIDEYLKQTEKYKQQHELVEGGMIEDWKRGVAQFSEDK